MGHGLVRVAKGQAFFNQVVGQVGGGGVTLARRLLHGLGIDRDAAAFLPGGRVKLAANHLGKDAQRVLERVHRIEQRLLVFLVVLVVGQRLALHEGDQAHQVTYHAAGLAACQLGHVGVFLLRHDGAAGGETVGDFDKAEVLAHPQDQLFAQAANVHHAQAGGGGEFNRKVAVAHGVQAVLADLRPALLVDHAQRACHPFPVQRVGGAGQCGAAQRQAVGAPADIRQSLGVAAEHLHIGQQVVAKAHWLRHLQVGEARHDQIHMALGHVHQRQLQLAQ